MISNSKHTVTIATYKQLLRRSHYCRLWMAVRSIKISRRSWLDELADTFRDYKGTLLQPNGKVFIVPCLDEAFGNDPDLRWLGYYIRPDKTGVHPKTVSRKLARVQLLDAYFRIKYPNIARHFGR